MKIQTRIILLILVVISIFFTGLYSIRLAEKQKTEEMLIKRKLEKKESYRKTLQLFGNNLEVYSKDYTQWDEMVDFLQNVDPLWASENIDFSINTYDANAAWILNKELSLVYSANNLSMSLLNKFPLEKEKIEKLFSDGYFCHFFVLIQGDLFEIRGAPIQPTSDLKRETKPKGFFFAGRLWSKDYLSEVGSQSSSQISLEKIIENNDREDADNKKFTITVKESLLGFDGKPLMNVVSKSDFSMLRTSAEIFTLQITLMIIFSLLVLFIVSYFLLKTVSDPLKAISKGLEEQDPTLLAGYVKSKTEFGKLSQLIVHFFEQKEQLIAEIHQRKSIENSLNKSEEKYRKIFENVQDIIFQSNTSGFVTSISPSVERYLGYTPIEIIGKHLIEFYSDPTDSVNLIQEMEKNGEVIDFEIGLITKSGMNVFFSLNSHFLYDEAGNIIGFEGTIRDINERKLNEEKILKLSRAIEQSPVSIVLTDTSGKIEYVNPRFVETSGYSYEELIGQSPKIIKSGLTPIDVYQNMWQTISEGNEWSGELQNKKKNGEILWEMVLISSIKNSDNEIINYLGIKEDITEKKKIIEELKSAKEKAEEMNNLKSSFLANMSHELRTPMMGILGNAEIIKISTDDSEIKEMADAIFSSGKRLITTLNLILDLSRVEANKESLDIENIEVVAVIRDIVTHFSSAAKQKNLSLKFDCNYVNVYSPLDERLFREVLNNLLNNAIKFTNHGSVTVKLISDNNKMILKVIDTGIGVPPESLGLIFDEFRQVSEGYGRSFEGTGLGLTITKRFVEKLGGKISVKSIMDEGSEFMIEFPLIKK